MGFSQAVRASVETTGEGIVIPLSANAHVVSQCRIVVPSLAVHDGVCSHRWTCYDAAIRPVAMPPVDTEPVSPTSQRGIGEELMAVWQLTVADSRLQKFLIFKEKHVLSSLL